MTEDQDFTQPANPIKISSEAKSELKKLAQKYEFTTDQVIDQILKDKQIINRVKSLLPDIREKEFKLINDRMALMAEERWYRWIYLKVRFEWDKLSDWFNKDVAIYLLLLWSILTFPMVYVWITSF